MIKKHNHHSFGKLSVPFKNINLLTVIHDPFLSKIYFPPLGFFHTFINVQNYYRNLLSAFLPLISKSCHRKINVRKRKNGINMHIKKSR